MRERWRVGLACLVVGVWGASTAFSDELVFGMSTALTGPAAELGANMKAGVDAAFAEANNSGGVRGRTLRLVAFDDGYEPSRTAPNMHALLNTERVLAVIGNVGTPTAVVASPIAIEQRTLFFGAYTGAGVLRKTPPDRYVINYRASYAEETGAMVDALVTHNGIEVEEIAFFTQRDAYGDAGYVGGIEAMKRHGLRDESRITHARYERNTDVVDLAVADILLAPKRIKAVVMVGAYLPCAKFIQTARRVGIDPLFLNVSFVGAEPLRRALGSDYGEVFVTQVVPHYALDLPVSLEYRAALHRLDVSVAPSFGSFEGYVAARILIRALRAHEGVIDRETVVAALEGLGEFDLGMGTLLTLSHEEHQASHQVWLTRIRPNGIEAIQWDDISNPVNAL